MNLNVVRDGAGVTVRMTQHRELLAPLMQHGSDSCYRCVDLCRSPLVSVRRQMQPICPACCMMWMTLSFMELMAHRIPEFIAWPS